MVAHDGQEVGDIGIVDVPVEYKANFTDDIERALCDYAGISSSDITKYIKSKYKLLIGERTAEDIKINIGTVLNGNKKQKMEVRGRDLVVGLPHSVEITSEEVEEAVRGSVYEIIKEVKNVLEQTPPELAADIIDKGIVITGGGSLIEGFDKLLAKELNVSVYVAESPLTCVAEGTGILLDNLNIIEKQML